MVNARTIFDAGGIIGYCTDTTLRRARGPRARAEVDERRVLDAGHGQDHGPEHGAYLGMEDQLGTLEAGKLADIILLDGDPLEGYWNWLKTKVTIKEGKVVVDTR